MNVTAQLNGEDVTIVELVRTGSDSYVFYIDSSGKLISKTFSSTISNQNIEIATSATDNGGGGGGGGITDVTASSPLVSSGSATRNISIDGITTMGTSLQVMGVDASGMAMEWVSSTGTGRVVRDTTPTINGATLTGTTTIDAAGTPMVFDWTGVPRIGGPYSGIYVNNQTTLVMTPRPGQNNPTVSKISVSNNATSAPTLMTTRRRGTAGTAGTAPLDGDYAYAEMHSGSISMNVMDRFGLGLRALFDGNWIELVNHGMYYTWFGTPYGSINTSEWMRLYRGALLVGTTDWTSGDLLKVGSSFTVTDSNITMSVKSTFSASTTSNSSFNIPAGTAPTTPTNGDMWSDGDDLFIHINDTTYTLNKTSV